MNNKRRSSLVSAKSLLTSAASIVERALDRESDCLDNIPENMQDGDRYDKMEQAVANLEEALENIENAIDKIDDASV